MGDPVFVLDANVFIEAARRYYAFDLAPKFWQSLAHHATNGRIESIDRIGQELLRGSDDLAKWAKSRFSNAFACTDDEDVLHAYRDIINWVTGQSQFLQAAKADFATSPDGWLVAYARAKGRVLVTQEVLDPNIRRKVPIPNICRAPNVNVSFINTFEMLRKLGVRWVH